MNIKPPTRQIELHIAEHPPRRVEVGTGCVRLTVPELGLGGFSLVNYTTSGRRTDDGVEIWTPQNPQPQ